MGTRDLESRIESLEFELQKAHKRQSEIVELLALLEQADFQPTPIQKNQLQQRIQRLKQK